jgi:hypothetical protein
VTKQEMTRFLNVDLSLRLGRGHTGQLMRFLETHLLLLHSEGGHATFEHRESPSSAEKGIVRIAAIVKRLPPTARVQWNRCRKRTMDVGVEGGLAPHQTRFGLGSSALRALIETGAELVFTVYAPSLK